ncbi:hypothetical protein QQS21_010496 [Conoideocrella luteorostrata]|uniref:DUF2612 domain-containing protein n=1 Tax=Conoideocrella luteorostrata TaxID=1105319 RepID=A0AAJ0FWS8_9HYPO|nr:hypothetical protein QQS21_010496 [Conoideocrella luteorostrata]
MTDIDIFNSLTTLSESNQVLNQRLVALGPGSDLAELRDIFQRFDATESIGLALLHKHFSISPGERVVEFGHVSTPWPVPADGKVAGGYVVPRSWRFWNGNLEPYEFGFNHPGQEDYEDVLLPVDFVEQLRAFLSKTNLLDVLGVCVIGAAEIVGRIEKNRGRVNFTVPAAGPEDLDVTVTPTHSPSVWSFDCKSGLNDATIKLARACWVCPKH